jgi:ribokinase
MPPVVVGLGALNIDRIYHVKKMLADGETAIDGAGTYPGGSAANTIYGLSRMGVAAGFCGAVGDDEGGRMLLADFKKAGTDTSRVVVKAQRESGAVFCLSYAASRSLYVLPGANAELAFEDIDMNYINSAAWLHLTSFVDDAQFEMSQEIVTALDSGVKLSFAPGALYVARGMKALDPMLSRADILFLNRQEIEELTAQGFEAGADVCLKAGCRMVAVTLGAGIATENGPAVAYVRDSHGACWVGAGQANGAKSPIPPAPAMPLRRVFLHGILSAKTPLPAASTATAPPASA